MRALCRTSCITAFDRALEKLYEQYPEDCGKYIDKMYPVFKHLTFKYIEKDTLKIAYYPYILLKYDVLKYDESGELTEILFELLRSLNIYCRENTLKAIYGMQKETAVATALSIIDKNITFHHPKLICDGLLTYKGDKEALKNELLGSFGRFSVEMKLNILNYFRFGNIRCDDVMLEILNNEKEDKELRFAAIRYFEKFPLEEARGSLQKFAENKEKRTWEYQSIASSALKSYKDDITFRILVNNLSSSNWYIRSNSAASLEKLGYTYHDLISVFDGNDRYAREIIKYYLDKRRAEEGKVNA